MTPTARSMAYLRKQGWIVARMEQRLHIPNSPFPITRDAFGFGDLLAAHPLNGIALIQVTSTANLNAREIKIHTTEIYQLACVWIRAGGKVLLQGWAKRGPRGKRKTWQLTEREIVLPS